MEGQVRSEAGRIGITGQNSRDFDNDAARPGQKVACVSGLLGKNSRDFYLTADR